MSTDGSFGGEFSISFCEVVDVKNDPSQSGQVRVREWAGTGQTDQLQMTDRPWHPCMFPPSNPNLKNIGGPHTGIKVGTKVLAISLGKDKQDKIILGTLSGIGTGSIDTPPTFNSTLPPHGKIQQVGNIPQPDYGDYAFSGMTAQDTPDQPQMAQQQQNPIWYMAQTQLGIGQIGNNALYADLGGGAGGGGTDGVQNVAALTVGFPTTG